MGVLGLPVRLPRLIASTSALHCVSFKFLVDASVSACCCSSSCLPRCLSGASMMGFWRFSARASSSCSRRLAASISAHKATADAVAGCHREARGRCRAGKEDFGGQHATQNAVVPPISRLQKLWEQMRHKPPEVSVAGTSHNSPQPSRRQLQRPNHSQVRLYLA